MAMEEFNTGIQEAGLLPLPMQGEWYTWHNCSTTPRSLWKRLDRILINDRWLARFPISSYHCLTPRTSDHSPLVLHGDTQQQNGGMFRFDNYLAHSPDFIPSVQNIWQHEVVGVPMYAVSRKLKALKPVFRQQRRNKGDLTLNVQLAKGFLEEAQNLRRAVRRILQINDENGTTHTEPSEVVQEFVSFYQNLLGGNRHRLLVDINYLRPWARHILSNEEASHLTLPFSSEDVKLAIFYIAEDKAPGRDGFSSGFFKAAWPVVGTEVTRAVLDFFTTGKLLKQVNTTLLALIPKIHTPMSVNDFRPISCCNVLYKVITKLLVQRLSMELFTGYNQIRLPPRCALKVDIRKAYDTVEWDFLNAVLQFFNFPTTFIRWIEECITTASFSIGLNGKTHGFYNGARGLRQGDPLSPYLFVLVMEILHLEFLQLIEQDMQFTYHWKCEPARVFQLGFADDLLLFCGAEMESIRVFKIGLDRFAEWSGLQLNIQKSHLILSRSAQDRREQMLAVLGFQEGHLPMRYLGLPLLSSRLSISDCQPLLSKIDARITGWEGISLSYAGRVQIIKSVLSTLSLYWASAFILPKVVIKEVDKRLRTFLWKGSKPVEEGGLGIKDIGILNRALMTKKLCDVIRCDRTSISVEWLQHGRLQNNSIWTVGEHGGSWGWRKMLRLRRSIQPMVELHIGDGRSFYLWKDPWHQLGPLLPRFPRGPSLLGLEDSTKLSSVIDRGQWYWPLITDLECLQITYTLPQIHGGNDRIGDFLRGDPLPKHFTDFFARLNRKWAGLHYFRDL
ncbi:UNVERIFIED_CONTAM: putative mitochondrial protein [Sesamum indicum]